MAVKIRVKSVKPYKEITLDVKNIDAVFGCKVYDSKELKEVRNTFQNLVGNEQAERLIAQLQELETKGDRTSEEFYEQRNYLRTTLDNVTESREQETKEFYKSQILYIRNAVIEVEDEKGASKDIRVADTRSVTPVESLWESSDECLAVLLDAYLSIPSLGDSLISKISETILNINLEDKVKNSK